VGTGFPGAEYSEALAEVATRHKTLDLSLLELARVLAC
jgi:hypothetical protein